MMEATSQEEAEIEREIRELEDQLLRARARLSSKRGSALVTKAATRGSGAEGPPQGHEQEDPQRQSVSLPLRASPPLPSSTHFLLLLSDSALPLGAFAFSSGLESYLAHTRPRPGAAAITTAGAGGGDGSFASFLPVSVSAYASTTLPFALASHRDPTSLVRLDDALDAAIICTVGRRASVAQGRALLSVWERCFLPATASAATPLGDEPSSSAAATIRGFAAAVRAPQQQQPPFPDSSQWGTLLPPPSAHLAPLFGAVCAALGLSAEQTAFVFMLSHVKALVSAAVRAGVFGPYQAQRLLAGAEVRALVDAAVRREWGTKVEDAGQSVPVMDLWIGRHEVLYSRIFNS